MNPVTVLSFIMAVVVFFLIGSFTAMSPDPRDWTPLLRFICGAGAFFFWIYDIHTSD